MRDILERCVELDKTAAEAYRGMAAVCEVDPLRTVFEQLAKEEVQHVDWWGDLLAAWESGLLPDIADEHEMVTELAEVKRQVNEVLPDRFDTMSTDDMLDLAARLEFFMLDPVFGELSDLMEPGSTVDRREAYSRHVIRLVQAIEMYHSSQGPAMFLARMLVRAYRDQQRLTALSVRDQLTGLYNRRGLLGHLDQWLAWSARYLRPVAVILIDVDHFKGVNDRFGHLVGDTVLREVARALRRGVRTSDLIGRFGGDEFVVLAPEASEVELTQLMERLLASVREMRVTAAGASVEVTVSVGGAWVAGGSYVEPETIVASADRSLYEAKEAGRDRVGTARQAFAIAAPAES